MENEKNKLIKSYIYENIKVLEDRKAEKEEKKISRMLIEEEIDYLLKRFLLVIKSGQQEKIDDYKSDIREVKDILESYLIRLGQRSIWQDKDIIRIYKKILLFV